LQSNESVLTGARMEYLHNININGLCKQLKSRKFLLSIEVVERLFSLEYLHKNKYKRLCKRL